MKKDQAIKIAYSCASNYKENLLNRSVLFIVADKEYNIHAIEVYFSARQFQHLTGLKTKSITAVDFFNRCIDRRLSEEDVEFATDGTTELKLSVLPDLMREDLSANMIGDYNNYQPKLITKKLAGNTNACMGFIKDKKTKRYVPNTVLREDIRNITECRYRILLTYIKGKDEEKYSKLVHRAKNVDWKNISMPEEYDYLAIINNEEK